MNHSIETIILETVPPSGQSSPDKWDKLYSVLAVLADKQFEPRRRVGFSLAGEATGRKRGRERGEGGGELSVRTLNTRE